MHNKIAVMSDVDKAIQKAVADLGFTVVECTAYKDEKDNPESAHADMQIMIIKEGCIFLIENNEPFNSDIIKAAPPDRKIVFEKEIHEFSYPQCVKLNAAAVGRNLIANIKYCGKSLISLLPQYGYNMIHVNQGYAKCSVAVVDDNSIITADKGIACAAKKHGIDALLISPGGIELCGRYGGFIGGACFLADRGTLAFTGDITAHPDYISIRSFCKERGVNVVSLTNAPLFDIGGVIIL